MNSTDKPTPPLNLRVKEVYKDYIVMNWDKPNSDGGSEITGYSIEKCTARKSTYMSCGTTNASIRTFKITKLVEGNDYYVRVTAENVIGVSDPTTTGEPIRARLPFGEFNHYPFYRFRVFSFLFVLIQLCFVIRPTRPTNPCVS